MAERRRRTKVLRGTRRIRRGSSRTSCCVKLIFFSNAGAMTWRSRDSDEGAGGTLRWSRWTHRWGRVDPQVGPVDPQVGPVDPQVGPVTHSGAGGPLGGQVIWNRWSYSLSPGRSLFGSAVNRSLQDQNLEHRKRRC